MKKTYIAPEAVEYKVSTVEMLAGSPGLNNEKGNGVQLVNEEDEKTTGIWDLY